MPYTRLNVTNRVVSFPPLEPTIPLEVNSPAVPATQTTFSLPNYRSSYCIQKFNLRLNFTITFQIHNKTNQHL